MSIFSKYKLFLTALFIQSFASVSLAIESDNADRHELTTDIELVANTGRGDFAPFWFTSDRQGLSPYKSNGLMTGISIDGISSFHPTFSLNYSIKAAAATGYQSEFCFQEYFVDATYRCFNLSVGAKERWSELKNNQLSTGGLTWSGNSRPIPQVRLEIPEFTRLPFWGSWFSLKGHIAYGQYLDSDWRRNMASRFNDPPQYSDGILHHSKSLFLKAGDASRFPLELTFGLEMYAQFGGARHNIATDATHTDEYYEFPHDLASYVSICLPFNRAGEQTRDNGNTLGSWHLAFDLKTEEWKYRLYYEHFFEDHSSMLGVELKTDLDGNRSLVSYGMRRNWIDGLFGFEATAPEGLPFRHAVLEVLNTRGQCGPIYRYPNTVIKECVDGRDMMYIHEFYKSYTHFGLANGTPVLISPMYNVDGDLEFKSNRVMMFHLGLDGAVSKYWEYRLLTTGTWHWGTYDVPLVEKESVTSLFLEFYRMPHKDNGWKAGVSLGADIDSGNLIGNSYGLMFSISKKFNIL